MGNQEVSNKNHTFFALQGQMFGLVYQLSQVTLKSQTQYLHTPRPSVRAGGYIPINFEI